MTLRKQNNSANRIWLVLPFIVLSQFFSVAVFGQSTSTRSASLAVPISTPKDLVGNELVFESGSIAVRHITIQPYAAPFHYRHPGGSIILLQEFSMTMPIPLGEVLDGQLKVGDVIRVPAGDYVLENPTTKPLDFLSIEKKER